MTANIWTTGGGEWDSSQILCEEAELNADGAQQGEGPALTLLCPKSATTTLG